MTISWREGISSSRSKRLRVPSVAEILLAEKMSWTAGRMFSLCLIDKVWEC